MDELKELVAEELAAAVDPRVSKLAAAIAARHGAASRAVLFYGSCLREKQLDGLMLDFYLRRLARAAYDKNGWPPRNRSFNPTCSFRKDARRQICGEQEADFRREIGARPKHPRMGRFAHHRGWLGRGKSGGESCAVKDPLDTFPSTLTMMAPTETTIETSGTAASSSLPAELRASVRVGSIVAADPVRFEGSARRRFDHCGSTGAAQRRWPDVAKICARFRRSGREGAVGDPLAKASADVAGGIDYIAWKINRHAGTQIQIKPWQRRWPLLAAITLLPRLLKSGAVR